MKTQRRRKKRKIEKLKRKTRVKWNQLSEGGSEEDAEEELTETKVK